MTGDDVKELRKQMRLSYEQFADKVGVSWSQVWRWEHGKTNPSPMAQRLLGQVKSEFLNSKSEGL